MVPLEEAKKLYNLGYTPIPQKQDKTTIIQWGKFQQSKVDSTLINAWFPNNENVALIVNSFYGFIVLDIEPGEDMEAIKIKYDIPETVCSRTGGGGWHFYFQYPEGENLSNIPLGTFEEKMELKVNSLITVPPSIHQSGKQYEWVNSIFDYKMAELPPKLLETARTKREEGNNWEKVLQGVSRGARNMTAAQVAGKLLHSFPQEEWETTAWPFFDAWCKTCNPPLPQKERVSVFKSIANTELARIKKDETSIASDIKPVSLKELMQKDFPETEWIIERLIPAASVVALSGYAGACKTWFALKIALEVAKGGILFDQFPTTQVPILLIDEETGEKWIKRRIEMLEGSKELPIHILSKKGFSLEEKKVEGMLLFCKEKGIKLLIIDSLSQVNTAKDENDAIGMARVFGQVQRFCKEGIAVLFVHHHRKPSGYTTSLAHDMRGSSHILAAVDVHLVVERKRKEDSVIITQDKMRHEEEIKPFRLNIVKEDGKYGFEFEDFVEVEQTKKEKFKESVVDFLEKLEGKPIYQKKLHEALKDQGVEGGGNTFSKAISELHVEGKIYAAQGRRYNKKYLSFIPITPEALTEVELENNEE